MFCVFPMLLRLNIGNYKRIVEIYFYVYYWRFPEKDPFAHNDHRWSVGHRAALGASHEFKQWGLRITNHRPSDRWRRLPRTISTGHSSGGAAAIRQPKQFRTALLHSDWWVYAFYFALLWYEKRSLETPRRELFEVIVKWDLDLLHLPLRWVYE